MPIVLDCSMTMALSMDDEHVAGSEGFLTNLAQERAVVPSLWIYEVANSLLVAARRGRITREQCQPRMALILRLPVDREEYDADRISGQTLAIAMVHNLTIYDAAYLELAIRLALPLATLDRKLAQAARAEHVEVIGG